MPTSLHIVQRVASPLLHMAHLPLHAPKAQNEAMNLTRIRQAKGLTQRALGELIGMDAATINRAEKMDRTAKLHTYILCAEALGVSLSDLFADDRTAIEAELVKAFREVPPDRHDELLAILRMIRAQG